MKTREEIFKMITDGDYADVVQVLELICTPDQQTRLKNLMNDYQDQPIGFNRFEFIQKLKILTNDCLKNEKYNALEIVDTDFYSALCQLDFKRQTNHFEEIYKHKKIAPFLLHGKSDKEESDLKWLYNQLLHTAKLLDERSMIIDCGSNLGGTFERLLDELYRKFEVNSTTTANKPLAVLRNKIQKRLETGPFVCIIKNATKFLWNETELCKLFEQLLKYLDQEMVIDNGQHAFILLFVDSGASDYKDQYTNYFLWFDESKPNRFSHNAVNCPDMKIFDLSPIRKIEEKDIMDWIGWSLKYPSIWQQISAFDGKENTLLQGGDTPFEVIQQICSTLKIKIEDKWIT